jgi:hypothetical protein
MPKVPHIQLALCQDAEFMRPDKRQVLMAVALGVSLTTLIFLSGRHGAGAGSDPVCEALDPAASEVVGRLVHARDEASQARLTEAVFRLRRARKNCRYGFVGLARGDYKAVLDAQLAPTN